MFKRVLIIDKANHAVMYKGKHYEPFVYQSVGSDQAYLKRIVNGKMEKVSLKSIGQILGVPEENVQGKLDEAREKKETAE